MKGLELPVNVLVLIAIAVIVLLAVIVLFFGSFAGPSNVVTLSTVTSTACADWRNRGFGDARLVTITNFDADKDGQLDPGTGCGPLQDNLENLYVKYYSTTASCFTGINANEQTIRTQVCGFP